MAQKNTLDRVIRKDPQLGASRPLNSHDGKLVVVDVKAEKALSRKPLITLGRVYRYWLVRSDIDGEGTRPPLEARDFVNDRTLEICVVYRARCPSGNEEKVALALGRDENPITRLDALLEIWTLAEMRGLKEEKFDPVGDFFGVRERWASRIEERARKETGLEMEVRLEVEGEKALDTIKLERRSAQVRVKDYADSVTMIFSADLDVDDEKKAMALLGLEQKKELEKAIGEEIREQFLQTSLQQLCFGLDGPPPLAPATSSIRQQLRGRVSDRAKQFGRMLSFFAIEPAPMNWLPQRVYEIRHSVNCDIRKYPEPIVVQHTLLLTLIDVGRFMSRRIGDVKDHYQKLLGEVTRSKLLKATYVDLLLKFATYESEIEQDIKKDAENAGLAVEQLISIPNLREIGWRDKGFDINTVRMYDTKVAAVKVEITVVGRARLGDLDSKEIRPRIDRRENMPLEVTKDIETATATVLHKTEPERYYLHFFASKEGYAELGLEAEIKQAIKEALDRYKLIDVNFAVKPGNDKLKDRHDKLVEGTHKFSVIVNPYRESAAPETVTCKVEFRIEAVASDGWQTFIGNQGLTYEQEIEAIKGTFSEDVRNKLATIPMEMLRWTDYKTSSDIEARIITPSIKKICKTYGLLLQLVNFGRDITARDAVRTKFVEDMSLLRDKTDLGIVNLIEGNRYEEIKALQERLIKLRSSSAPDDYDVENCERRLNQLIGDHEKRAITPHLPSFDHQKKSSPFNFDDFGEVAGAEAQNQLKDKSSDGAPQQPEELRVQKVAPAKVVDSSRGDPKAIEMEADQ